MGGCLSCLGLDRDSSSEPERARLLYPDDSYSQSNFGYGSSQIPPGIAPQDLMSQEEIREEQEMMDNITRHTNDQVVEIFPHQASALLTSSILSDGTDDNSNAQGPTSTTIQQHSDILLAMIPGDKSKRSIRIFPSTGSRPGSAAGLKSIRGKDSHTKLNGSVRSKEKGWISVLTQVDMDPP